MWQEPIFYDFGPGGNVVFNDNRVFISGVDVGSVDEFAQSAAELATVPPPDDISEVDATEWMPLGTFAVSTSELEGEPTRFVQLAVSQQGIVTGTYFNSQTDVSQTVLGQVDRETQRVAMRLGEDEDLVIETGLYNLTLDEAPVLVHFGSQSFRVLPAGPHGCSRWGMGRSVCGGLIAAVCRAGDVQNQLAYQPTSLVERTVVFRFKSRSLSAVNALLS